MAKVGAGSEVARKDGVIVGPLRRSVNASQQAKGSIHNDEVATKLGFRGGTVAGSIHLELFPPLLVEAFGPRWFERGSLSIYFVNATTDREAVRAHVGEPPDGGDAQVEAWIEREDGMRVGEGTAAVGDPGDLPALHQRQLDKFPAGELRMFSGLEAGHRFDEADVRLGRELQDTRLRHGQITEPLEWYDAGSPWGGPVASPATMVHLLYQEAARQLGKLSGPSVGLFGAIELRNVDGPVLLDRDYRLSGQIVAVGQSPKTEYVWFDTAADDGDRRVAEMRMLMRWMKASSPRYQ